MGYRPRVLRPVAACGRWEPSGGPQSRQSPCSAQKRRSSVTYDHPWSAQVTTGQPRAIEARYRRSTEDDAAATCSAANRLAALLVPLFPTGRAVHAATRAAPRAADLLSAA